MTSLYYLLIVTYLLIAVPTLFLCCGYILVSFIQEFIIPKITYKQRYKRSCVIVCCKDTNYIGVLYNKKKYFFHNKKLYNSVNIGDMIYASIRKRHNKLYLKKLCLLGKGEIISGRLSSRF